MNRAAVRTNHHPKFVSGGVALQWSCGRNLPRASRCGPSVRAQRLYPTFGREISTGTMICGVRPLEAVEVSCPLASSEDHRWSAGQTTLSLDGVEESSVSNRAGRLGGRIRGQSETWAGRRVMESRRLTDMIRLAPDAKEMVCGEVRSDGARQEDSAHCSKRAQAQIRPKKWRRGRSHLTIHPKGQVPRRHTQQPATTLQVKTLYLTPARQVERMWTVNAWGKNDA